MRLIFFLILIFVTLFSSAQNAVIKNISETNPPEVALKPLRFLASDELMGRSAMRPEADIAARYISELFRSFGLKEVKGTTDYFQEFDIKLEKRPDQGGLTIAGTHFKMMESLLSYEGNDTTITAPVVYVGFGMEKDLGNIDLKGKIVVSDFGENENSTLSEALTALYFKKRIAFAQKGALAVIERFKDIGMSWEMLREAATQEILEKNNSGIRILYVNDAENIIPEIPADTRAELSVQNKRIRTVKAKNVMGYIEGTDPKLKHEYILLSAHYDHIGIAAKPVTAEGKTDSICNGARDNAVGVASLISASRYFAKHPPKRSVLFISYGAEEVGLVGSKYFVGNPPLPLSQIVFNLNNDNTGYNNTSSISVLGSGRTTADDDIRRAAASYQFDFLPELFPEERRFMRSDNFPLAQAGIPAITFTMAIDSINRNAQLHYHSVLDEVENMDLEYVLKFIHSYILAAKNIADNPKQPTWTEGQEFEEAWKKLYGK